MVLHRESRQDCKSRNLPRFKSSLADYRWICWPSRRRLVPRKLYRLQDACGAQEENRKEIIVTNRVVITGLGALTCIGHGKEGLWKGILREQSGIGPISRFKVIDYHSTVAGEINDYDAHANFPAHRLKRLDRYAQFALVTTQQALTDARLELSSERPRFDVGVSFGTALGGITNAEAQHVEFIKEGVDAIPVALALQVFGGSAHSNIAIAHGCRGYATTNSNSCASGTVSIGEAYRVLREGGASVMIAGGAEAPLSPLTFGAFDKIKAMAKEKKSPAHACRPFDRTRDGFVMAEGAACVILETLEHAQKRNAHIYCEVRGYCLNNDAYHMSSSLPTGEAAIQAMKDSIAQAGLEPSQIDYINAHASSTMMNDVTEGKAIAAVFGDKSPPISGTKSYYGHPLGATGTVEAVICALAIENQYIPPTLNCTELDPELPASLDIVRLHGRPHKVDHVLTNSFGFGGINSTLILSRFQG